MIRSQSSSIISIPTDAVFEYVAEGFFLNYPRWSPEVISVQAISSGPVKLGTIGRQVRIDMGLRTQCEFRISSFEPCRRIDFHCLSIPLLSSYRMDKLGDKTRLTFIVEYTGSNFMLLPFRRQIDKLVLSGTKQVVSNIKALLESADNPRNGRIERMAK